MSAHRAPEPADQGAPADEVLMQAAYWFSVLRSPRVSDREVRAWRAWRDACGANRDAWARVEAISGTFEFLPASSRDGAREVLTIAASRQLSRRRAVKLLSLAVGAGIAGWTGLRTPQGQLLRADLRSATGERRELQLADGGRLWLNSATAVDVDYSAGLRRLRLHAGEILVQTADDSAAAARPFVVDTAHGRLRALGTRFSVRQLDGGSEVAVFEGAVEIRTAQPGAAALVLRAGEQARFSASAIGSPEAAATTREAWSRGLLVAENMRLGDFIDELARHRRGHLGCDPAVADLRIVGVYELADTDRVLHALEGTLPVTVRRRLPWWVVVTPR